MARSVDLEPREAVEAIYTQLDESGRFFRERLSEVAEANIENFTQTEFYVSEEYLANGRSPHRLRAVLFDHQSRQLAVINDRIVAVHSLPPFTGKVLGSPLLDREYPLVIETALYAIERAKLDALRGDARHKTLAGWGILA